MVLLASLQSKTGTRTMNRNTLYVVIGALAIAILVLAYWLYEERQKTTGIEISVGKTGISIDKK